MNAARALIEISKKNTQKYEIKAAANLGYCYAGLITTHSFSFYTTIGETVITAARLVSSINWGEFCLTHEMYMVLKDVFQFNEQPPIHVKGKPIRRYSFVSKAEFTKDKKRFVGREYFLSRLKKELLESDSIVIVESEESIGKTSLMREFLEKI
ncbi:MAG: adenylate/guanylate cyclase domain-containing protein [candidate division WOR-3 bacterium]